MMASPLVQWGIWLLFMPFFGFSVMIVERGRRDIGKLSVAAGIVSAFVTLNPALRYFSWAWISSKPPLTGLNGWLIGRSDPLWVIALVFLFVTGVFFGRTKGTTSKFDPRFVCLFSCVFPFVVAPLLYVLVMSTLIS
ncbi:MAG: hypothetical protein ACKVQS_13910 [Fimbriimonadaceae bacterium]